LRELGYEEGKTIVIEYRWADGNYERLPELAAQLVRSRVEVIVSHGTPGTLAAKRATATIPIVIANIGDPVATGIVASLARPGGNITGQTYLHVESSVKRLEWLKQLAPQVERVGLLLKPDNAFTVKLASSLAEAARSLGIVVEQFPVHGPEDFEQAFAAMTQKRVHAVCTDDDAFLITNYPKIADLAMRHRLLSVGRAEAAQAGLLLGYGENLPEMFRHAATFVDKILKGAKPADLPVQRPIRFELIINKRTATALGITVPREALLRADKVIE
jgi:putative ABC transport system substrate-binding protein